MNSFHRSLGKDEELVFGVVVVVVGVVVVVVFLLLFLVIAVALLPHCLCLVRY